MSSSTRTREERDPLSCLVEAMLENRAPDAGWMDWQSREDDPVAEAWQASDSYLMMLQLLCHRWPAFEEMARAATDAAVKSCTQRWKAWRQPPPSTDDFAPVITEWSPRFPAALANWLSDCVKADPAKKARVSDAIRSAVPTPPTLEDLTLRVAAAYELSGRIGIHGQFGWGGYYVVAPPYVQLRADSDAGEIGTALRDTLNAHRTAIPGSHEPGKAMKALLKELGAKSYRELQSDAKHCRIEATARWIRVVPTQSGGSRGDQRGFSPLEDRTVQVGPDVTDSELGAALVEAFRRCS